MRTGTQIVAPDGWKALPKDIVFHLLWNDSANLRVWLARFESSTTRSIAKMFTLSRQDFEAGVHAGALVQTVQQATLPPWLEELEGVDLTQIDAYRSNKAKMSHAERIEKRFLFIAPAIRDFKTIMTASDPELELNRRARACAPQQNETRFKLWFLTYVCFGRNIGALLPPFHHAGYWDRFLHSDTKFGAPSKAFGKHYGNGCSKEMADQCEKSYLARAKLGKSMKAIYEEAMTEDFFCRIAGWKNGLNIYVPPNGKRAPTYPQFLYRVHQRVGKETIHRMLYGTVRYRTKLALSKGRFTEEISNLMERVEVDAYYVKERPQGYLEGSALPPLCVAIIRDCLSGKKLGIGFSLGKEHGAAYRMALFSMVVPKDFFCRLFGIALQPGEWVNEGFSPHFDVDRGPGAAANLIENLEKRFPIRGIAPSWSGQSKATVESSHPNDVKLEGQPTFVLSNLTLMEMVRREILRLIEFNNTANMEARFDPDSELAYVEPSPCGLWKYYDSIFRNDGQPMSIPDAVRTFLTPTEFGVQEDGLYLKGRRFYCDELQGAGVLGKASGRGGNTTRARGYTLDMCVRHIWAEIEDRLIEVPAMLKIRGDEDSLYMSMSDLEAWDEARKEMASAFRVHQHATASNIKQRFKEDTGKAYDSGRRKPGKPKQDAKAKQEEADVLHTRKRRNAA